MKPTDQQMHTTEASNTDTSTDTFADALGNHSPQLAAARIRPRSRWPLITAGIVVFGLIGYLLLGNANNNLVYYVLPSEYQQDQAKFAGKTLRVGGLAKDINYNQKTLDLRFNITDGQVWYPVEYKGAVPDLFKKDAVVVMEGKMEDGVFYGSSLLVKHSEEYTSGNSQSSYSVSDLRQVLEQTE